MAPRRPKSDQAVAECSEDGVMAVAVSVVVSGLDDPR